MDKALLKEKLLELSPAERLEIVEEIWDSIPPEELPPLTDEQIAEVEKEWAEHQKDPTSAVPWEEVQRSLRSRFR
jgi:putative addiction module component (TIGR02574 family)